ncbi:MAG: cbb3-type cytochrome c oxidase subunit II [Proteobacteria bacterium]|nr:cbb3-type cytochrome c oxidase subunit II [Pseudomonadota bacterium]MBU1688730.1 cbb3-type cytochrome c oxidase subunit II [Pseudomonadota bacterium]
MKKAKFVALLAGFSFISLAIVVQAIIPSRLKETSIKYVEKTIRTPLGELSQIKADARPYEGQIEKGRKIYLREGCWYCHSMYIRPVAGEERRWGPVSQVGEYVWDTPHLFGTRRIGPDLIREGGKYGNDWHRVHFANARIIVPDSIMPKFPWLFETQNGMEVPNAEGEALIAFVQNLGMNRGKWRDEFTSQMVTGGSAAITTPASLSHGNEVYEKRCQGCHGEKGDGKGPAAAFFAKVLPRDFTTATFKFRTTPSGSLPLDTDLYRSITMGVPGTAMPPWFELPEVDRWDVVQYLKTFGSYFTESTPEPPFFVPSAPKSSEELLARGKELHGLYQCDACHGKDGKGDGPSAATLTDDWGDPIRPADFTTGVFKVGPQPEDIYRTVMTGLNGTPMPSYDSILSSEDDRWALAYFILSRSADQP